MNRKPRTEAELYRWHTETLAHIAAHGEADRNRPALHEDEPQCGWYRRRLVPKGPFVPARVWVEPGQTDPETDELISPEVMRCEVDGARVPVDRAWTWIARYPISEDQYMAMLAGSFAEPRAMTVWFIDEMPDPPGNKAPENITEIMPPKGAPGPGEPLF